MIRDQFILDISREIAVDNFAGGGGASTGIELALRRHTDLAVNHDREALGMHEMNHPQTLHLREDVFAVNPRTVTKGRPVGLAWFSPDCKHFSKAKGGKPVDKKIRGLALVILNWVATVRPRVIFKENVEEIQTWGPLLENGRPDPEHRGRTFKAFVAILGAGIAADHPDLPDILAVCGEYVTREQLVTGFGYNVQHRELRACDYGAPTIRKRFFLIARCDGLPIVWPAPTHAAPDKARAAGLKPWRTAAECIDFALPCPSIFLDRAQAKAARCKRPLVKASLARIAKGVDRYVLKAKEPFLVSLTHQGGDRVESLSEPTRTVTGAKRGEKALVAPYFVPRYGERPGQEPRTYPVTKPAPVIVPTGNGGSLVSPLLAGMGGPIYSGKPKSVQDPVNTLVTENHTAVIAPVLAGVGGRAAQSRPRATNEPTATGTSKADTVLLAVHLTKFNTGSVGSAASEPVPTVPAGSHAVDTHGGAATPHGLVSATVIKMRGDPASHAPGHAADEPLHVVSAGGTHHAVAAVYVAQHNGGEKGHQTVGHAPSAPVLTLSAKGAQQQVVAAMAIKYYGNETEGHGIAAPSGTVTTRDRIGHVEAACVVPDLTEEQLAGARLVAEFLRAHGVEFEGEFATVCGYVIVDIGMRMLTPRELFRAQGFPESYIIDRAVIVDSDGTRRVVMLSKEAQIRMCGNSVCPPLACALIGANVPEMAWEEAA